MPKSTHHRTLTAAARAAMSAGGKAAQASRWGRTRAPSATIRIDKPVFDEFVATIPARFRREIATGAIASSIRVWQARQAAKR